MPSRLPTARRARAVPDSVSRVGLRRGHGVATATAVSLAAVLLWLAPLGGITGVTLTTDALPLVVADGPSAPVVGFVGAGSARVYLSVPSVLAVVVGEFFGARDGVESVPVAVAMGVVGASSLVVLAGCGCGTGSAQYLVEAVSVAR